MIKEMPAHASRLREKHTVNEGKRQLFDATQDKGNSQSKNKSGTLYIIATPIGNSADLTARARAVLERVSVIICEDTRRLQTLLTVAGIKSAATVIAYHEHNAQQVRPKLLAWLAQGKQAALLSDAGTPLVSDPGYKLVHGCIENQIPFTALPGPSAVLNALVLSGLPPDRFFSAGFAPPKTAARQRWLAGLAAIDGTLIILESPRRLRAMLHDAHAVLGERAAVVCREMTKIYEEVIRAPLAVLKEHWSADSPPKGEIVVLIAPPTAHAVEDATIDAALGEALRVHGYSGRDAAAAVAAQFNLPKKRVYERVTTLKKKGEDAER